MGPAYHKGGPMSLGVPGKSTLDSDPNSETLSFVKKNTWHLNFDPTAMHMN